MTALLEHSLDLIAILDPNRVFRFTSPSFRNVLGYDAGELAGQDAVEFVHPDDAQQAAAVLQEPTGGRPPAPTSLRLRHRDGTWRWLRCLATNRVNDPGIGGIILNAHDITEERHALAAAAESERRFRAVADSAPVLIWMAEPDGRTTYFNRRWLDFTGASVSQHLGSGWLHAVYPADVARCLQLLHEQLKRREPFRFEFRLRHIEGEFRLIESHVAPRFAADGRYLGFTAAGIDATDRARAVAVARDASERLALALEAGKLGTWDWDMLTGQITWSAQHYLLFGLTPAMTSVTYETWSSATHPEDRAGAVATLERCVREASPYHSNYRIVWPDGSVHWIEGRGYFLPGLDGRPVRMHGMVMNIDERHAAEEEQERSARLESLGLVAGGLAHDFNNYLASIGVSLDLARLDTSVSAEVSSYLSEALKVVSAAQQLTRQLLTFAKGDTLRKSAVDLRELLIETAGFALRGSPVALDLQLAPDLWQVDADQGQIRQVASNLVMNARQALDRGPGRHRSL